MRKDHPLSDSGRYFAAKLAKTYSGPYKILEQLSQNVFKLEVANKKQSPKVHVRFLKKFNQPCVSGKPPEELAAMEGRQSGDPPKRPKVKQWRARKKGCLNCGGNHNFAVCPSELPGPVCGICGWKGVTKYHCPRPSCRRKVQSGSPRVLPSIPEQISAPEAQPSPPQPTDAQDPQEEMSQGPSLRPSVSQIGSLQDNMAPMAGNDEPVVACAKLTLTADSPDPQVRQAYALVDALFFKTGVNLRGVAMGVMAYVPTADFHVLEEEENCPLFGNDVNPKAI